MLRYVMHLLVRISPLHFLIASLSEMGWDVAIEKDKEIVEGLVIGTEEYIDRHIPKDVKLGG